MAVVPIGLVPDEGPKPNEKIVTMLREMLREAKQGRVQGIAIAVAIYDPTSLENKQSTENNYAFSIGYEYATHVALDNLKNRIHGYIEDYSVEIDEMPPLTDEDE